MDPRTLVGISHNRIGDQSLMTFQKPIQNINPITRSLINIDGVRLPINPANQLSVRPQIQQLQPQRFVDVVQLLIQNKSGQMPGSGRMPSQNLGNVGSILGPQMISGNAASQIHSNANELENPTKKSKKRLKLGPAKQGSRAGLSGPEMNFLSPHLIMPSRPHMLLGSNLQSNLEEIKENAAEDPQEEVKLDEDQSPISMMLNAPITEKPPNKLFDISSSGLGQGYKGPRTITNIRFKGVSQQPRGAGRTFMDHGQFAKILNLPQPGSASKMSMDFGN